MADLDEVFERFFSESQERPLEDSCQQSKKRTDEELIIELLEILISRLKLRQRNSCYNQPLNMTIKTEPSHYPISVQQISHIVQPPVMMEPSKPHYTDVRCSQNS